MSSRQLRPRAAKRTPLTETLTASKSAVKRAAPKRTLKDVVEAPAETSGETAADNAPVTDAELTALTTIQMEQLSTDAAKTPAAPAAAAHIEGNQKVIDTSSDTIVTRDSTDTKYHSSNLNNLSSTPPKHVIASRTSSGFTPINSTDDTEFELPAPKRRRRATKSQKVTHGADKPARKKREKFPAKLGHTPWPDFERPSPEECYGVHARLTKAHGSSERPRKLVSDTEVSGCGEVPHVLDALLRTYLSSATHNNNSTMAFKGVITKFGLVNDNRNAIAAPVEEVKVESAQKGRKKGGKKDMNVEGQEEVVIEKEFVGHGQDLKEEDEVFIKKGSFNPEEIVVEQEYNPFEQGALKHKAETGGQVDIKMEDVPVIARKEAATKEVKEQIPVNAVFGTVNWYAVHKAPDSELMEAIKCGGLAETKSKNIKAILNSVWNEMVSKKGSDLVAAQSEEQSTLDFLAALDYLRAETDMESVRAKLQAYPGIGLKTTMCVMCMCLGHDAFAVDTHVFRMSKFLGWLPPKANFKNACFHLDLRIPNELKYSLHNLLIRHGRSCKHCKGGPAAKEGNKEEEGEDGKPIKVKKPKAKKEKVEHDQKGSPLKVKRTKKVWTGNGLMKQTLIEVDTDEDVEEDDTCCLEDLVNRIREPRKEKANKKGVKTEGDAGEDEDAAAGEVTVTAEKGKGTEEQSKEATAPADDLESEV